MPFMQSLRGLYWWFNRPTLDTFILKGYIMNTVKIIFDKYGFWHVYRTDRVTGQRAISFFQNVDEAKASLLK